MSNKVLVLGIFALIVSCNCGPIATDAPVIKGAASSLPPTTAKQATVTNNATQTTTKPAAAPGAPPAIKPSPVPVASSTAKPPTTNATPVKSQMQANSNTAKPSSLAQTNSNMKH
ncbi:transcriptional regulatory protein AlgP-like [Neocloeon triangulifer]|uniref:transcriptional regulatory protein AlgP-like n=1 Tax=Neocloeon triangulifer TaxID=2078957 RepID=UPI00286FA78A|nr:transcriptional regulatory protein AlgP-like [Neocloeon triangulifer]